MNPYVLLAAVLGALALTGGVAWKAYQLGQDSVIASQAKQAQLIREVQAAAQKGAAEEIAKIEIKHTTVRQSLETEIREKPVYRDCVADDRVLSLVNQAITGAEPADPSVVPGTRPDDGTNLR